MPRTRTRAARFRQRFNLKGTIKARVLHVAGVGESTIDEWVADLETVSNPTVGLAAHPGQVDVRITAKAESMDAAMQMIAIIVLLLYEPLLPGISTPLVGTICIWIAAVLTLWSMIYYWRKAAPHLKP